jgi:glycosyltransferase involved in cell wall biosynthesis
MTLRLLFAIHGPPDDRTAVFSTVSARADYFRQLGHRVDVLTPADFGVARWTRLQPLTLPVAIAARDLRHYDVVVFHSYLGWAYQLRPRGGRGRGPATVVAFHGLEPLYHEAVAEELARTGERLSARFHLLHRALMPRLLELACRRADAVFCLNARERAFLLSQRWAEPSRVLIVANGVPADVLAVPRVYPATAQHLLFIGQWLRPKGIRYLAAAFELLARQYPDLTLTCAGTGAPAATVLQIFDRALWPRVRVLPRFVRDELAQELQRADLFVFPSLSEGSSGALLEAMGAGLPIVTTPAGAVPELLRAGIDAAIVPFADAAALAGRIAELIPDQPRRAALGTAARAAARQCTWGQANERFAAEILRVAAGRS